MQYLQTLDGFFDFCLNNDCTVESLHCGNAVYYMAFFMGRVVAQYVEYISYKS